MSTKAINSQVQKSNRNHNKTPLSKELQGLNKENRKVTTFLCDKLVEDFNDVQVLTVKVFQFVMSANEDNIKSGCVDFYTALPKVPLNPPGYKYLGPNNPSRKQIELKPRKPKKRNEPTNALDAIALKHDYLIFTQKNGVDKANPLRRLHLAQRIIIKTAKQTKTKTLLKNLVMG